MGLIVDGRAFMALTDIVLVAERAIERRIVRDGNARRV